MIYGQDEPIALPVADLYDSGMMQMYLTAVKDQYDQGRKDYENFVSKYGDFVSPIRSDVDYWNAHTMDPLNNLIEDMYANGIDPTRSPEARAIIQRQMRRIPYAKLSQMKQSADAANEYLKNRGAMAAKGLYNSDFENFILGQQGLPDFEHWDTSVNGIWNRTSPAEFKDLNQWTSHIFDDMKGEDLGLDPTGRYRVFGVTEDAMNRNLTPHIYGLAGSDLGQYYLDQAKRSLIAEGNTNPTDADVLNRLRRDIITANKERLTKKLETDDYAKMAQANAYDVQLENLKAAHAAARAANSGGGGGGYGGNGYNQYSFTEAVRRTSATAPYGIDPAMYTPELLNNQRDKQILFGQAVSNKYNKNSWSPNSIKAFQAKYTSHHDPETIAKYLGYKSDGKGRYYIPRAEIGRIFSEKSVVGNTTGFRGTWDSKKYGTNRKKYTDADMLLVEFTGETYGALMKDGRTKNYFRAKIKPYKNTAKTDADGKITGYVSTRSGNEENIYIDSHITSHSNGSKIGSLGIKGKSGKVTDIKNIKISNTQDRKYGDTQEGDHRATSSLVSNTGYKTDATLLDLENYPE